MFSMLVSPWFKNKPDHTDQCYLFEYIKMKMKDENEDEWFELT